MLGETIGPRRWAAVVVGFIGALVIIRPGAGMLDSGAPFVVASACCYSCYVLLTRKIAGSAPTSIMLVYTALVGAVVTSLAVPFVWVWPSPTQWLMMVAIGLIAAVSHLCIILANERAQASQLAPLAYAEIVMATALGYFLFGDFPDALTWLGIAIVIGAGVFISLRETGKRRR